MSRDDLYVVWGDTVSLKELIIGQLCGALAGYASFAAAVSYLTARHSHLTRGVLMGYALLIAVSGCVVVGALAAVAFKPKRVVREEGSVADTGALWQDLRTDPERESEYLTSAPPDVIAEMRRLGILHLFTGDRDGQPTNRR
jgi:hypothetical protein